MLIYPKTPRGTPEVTPDQVAVSLNCLRSYVPPRKERRRSKAAAAPTEAVLLTVNNGCAEVVTVSGVNERLEPLVHLASQYFEQHQQQQQHHHDTS